MLMCAIAPSRLFCSVLRNPLLMASATTSAITPAATPITDIAVMTEITASLRRAFRYRRAMKSSNEEAGTGPSTLSVEAAQPVRQPDRTFRPEQREQDHVPYGSRSG